MSKLIDADALEKDGWKMNRIVRVDKNTIEYQTKKPTDFPPIEPEQKWIPCSERLPEKPNMYTVTDSKGDVVRFVFYDTESSCEYWLRCVKAWMPLPSPYQEEGEQK